MSKVATARHWKRKKLRVVWRNKDIYNYVEERSCKGSRNDRKTQKQTEDKGRQGRVGQGRRKRKERRRRTEGDYGME